MVLWLAMPFILCLSYPPSALILRFLAPNRRTEIERFVVFSLADLAWCYVSFCTKSYLHTWSPREIQLSPGFSATPLTLVSLPCSRRLGSCSPLYPIMSAEDPVIGIRLERMDVG